MAMKWVKIEPGVYKSNDGRYTIRKTWNKAFGDHWSMIDNFERERILHKMDGMPPADINLAIRKIEIERSTLTKCKELAERI